MLESKSENILWVRLSSQSFGLQQDLYLCAVYVKPSNGALDESTFEILESEIAAYAPSGTVCLLGDFNARTGNLQDTTVCENTPSAMIPNKPNTSRICLQRNNLDSVINPQGRTLVDLCIASSMKILNGRTIGNSLGYFTCYNRQGCSTVDYAIVSDGLLSDVNFFTIHPIDYLSDHCLLELSIRTNVIQKSAISTTVHRFNEQYIWKPDSPEKFLNALEDDETINEISKLQCTHFPNTKEGVNKACNELQNILCNAANKSLAKRKPPRNGTNKTKRVKKHPWFDGTCAEIRRNIKHLGKLLQNNPGNNFVAHTYHEASRKYKQLIKRKKREHKDFLLKRLLENEEKNPKEFWEVFKNLKEKETRHNLISPDIWLKHFHQLCGIAPNENNIIDAPLKEMERQEGIPILDSAITCHEVKNALKKLKSGKAAGEDAIKNEMLKVGTQYLAIVITKIFNLILNTTEIPDTWNLGIIIPIHKSGEHMNPSNYRGLCITSCLGKLFNSILFAKTCDVSLTVRSFFLSSPKKESSQVKLKKLA
ncbi:uncharacterized protein LOC106154306 [Lingula anatina]|uniref:Uncharacterized protein LOC106154306 n=1 Tax=Lingula anatina TaxID=7574 RepID=A0A1S3HDH9_LINAN|nr:uncharacterized protein LOC106154306 [Lingula anatina]|eukprot:XP_013384075.1 uncharacterized protein LOC106154306 [Lingula anatina]